MKKTMLLLGALMFSAAAGYAQESRQDVSVSATAAFAPQVTGNSVQKNTSTTMGLLASYRYMLTPRSALEVAVDRSETRHRPESNSTLRVTAALAAALSEGRAS